MDKAAPERNKPDELSAPISAGTLRSLERPGVAWVVLGLCLCVTLISWQVSELQLRHRSEERFLHRLEQVKRAIQLRMQAYQQVLKGTKGLFAASEVVKRQEWREYFDSLDINDLYAGIRALGYIAQVAPENLAGFVASNRLDGVPNFAIQSFASESARPRDISVHYVVQFAEPQGTNSMVLGYDLAGEPRRREAAEAARDSGEATLTARIKLVQSAEDTPAVLLLLPIYRNGALTTTVEDRRRAIEGWVYAAFVMHDLMAGLLEAQEPDIDFEIFDGNRPTRAGLLHDADGILHAFEAGGGDFNVSAAPLSLAGRYWSLNFFARPAFHAATDHTEADLLLFGGIAISFLLFGITRSLASTRQRALILAQQMTEKFRIQERAVISSSNGIFITDASERDNPIIYANPALEHITGYLAEEIVGNTLAFLAPGDTDQPGLKKLERAMTEGTECRVVLQSHRRDRTVFWNELSVSPVRDEAGLVTHFVGITEDITERMRAEEALRETSALQRAILDSADYAVISGDSGGIISIFNAAAERMLGYRAGEVVGKATPLIWHDRAEMEARAAELTRELGRPVDAGIEVFISKPRMGKADENEWTFVRKDGTRLPVLLSVTPVRDEQGKILGFMGIASDITERKRAEARLQQVTLAATAASRAKSEFLANMSHEIRTPMNAVIGMTNLALGTGLTREQRGYLSSVKNSASDLLAIIDDVLDFSKVEAGRMELRPEPFRLRDVLAEALKMFGLRAQEKGLELVLRVDPATPDVWTGDAGRLRQILNNLVGNALKFTEHGEVLVSVAPAGPETSDRVGASGAGASACEKGRHKLLQFTVADTGIGVPPEMRQTIFEAFTQVDASVTRKHGGAGLGLAISEKLCRLMGGRIWVESEPGQGSQFHFTAAFDPVPDEVQPAASAEPPDLTGKHVLVVDDNATVRRVLCEMLSGWRMIPVAAGDSTEALMALQQLQADGEPAAFALIDSALPRGAGFKLASELKHTQLVTIQTVLMLPSLGSQDEIRRWREMGNNAFLAKPVGQSELLEVMLQSSAPEDRLESSEPPVETGASRGLRVLLAEDNSVNRELAATVLRKLGHSVVNVWNGREAFDTWKAGGVDLILMDVQMPIMDGFEATGMIRRAEQGTGRRVPIVGLTAHAMKGDREDGLAAGMDEYLTKPLKLDDLSKAIALVNVPSVPVLPWSSAAFDPARLLKSFDGDQAVLQRLLGLYFETAPPLVEQMRDAVARRDSAALLYAAHTLKGSLAQIGDTTSMNLAARLEELSRHADMEGAAGLFAELESRLAVLDPQLRHWLQAAR